MDFLQQFADNSQYPLITAFLLGLMTAVSPCPLATNISAVGYISKDLQNRRKVFVNGLWYTLGRVISYTLLAIMLIALLKQGSNIYHIQKWVNQYGIYLLGPLLLLIGFFMLGLFKLNIRLPWLSGGHLEEKFSSGSSWGSFFLGLIFALAFCPYSGVLYFGGLIPLAVASPHGYMLPIPFAVATGLPVILFAWVLAFSVSGLSLLYNRVKTFEFWFRRIVAIIFIVIGLYFSYIAFIQ